MGILGEHQESQGQEGGGLGPLVSGYSPAGKDMFPQLATLTLRSRVSCSLSSRSPCPSSWLPHIAPDISLPLILHWQHRGSCGSFSHWRRSEVSRKPSLVPSIEEQEPGSHSQNRIHRPSTIYHLYLNIPCHCFHPFLPCPLDQCSLFFTALGFLEGPTLKAEQKCLCCQLPPLFYLSSLGTEFLNPEEGAESACFCLQLSSLHPGTPKACSSTSLSPLVGTSPM